MNPSKKKIHGTSEKIYRVKSSRAILFPFPLETYKVSKTLISFKKKRAEQQERSAGGQIKHIMSNVITNTTFLHPTACNFIDLGRWKVVGLWNLTRHTKSQEVSHFDYRGWFWPLLRNFYKLLNKLPLERAKVPSDWETIIKKVRRWMFLNQQISNCPHGVDATGVKRRFFL